MPALLTAPALPTLLIAVPIAGACVLLVAGRWVPRPVVDTIGSGVALLSVLLAALLLHATAPGRIVNWAGGWQPRHGVTVGIVLVADRLNTAAVLLAAVLTSAALLFGWRYFESVHAHYHALVLLFLAGMTGFALTGDVFDMFVFFELMGAAGYALAGFKIEDPEAVQGALNFGVVNSLGAYLGLVGIGLIYGRTGQLGLPQIGAALAGRGTDPLVLTGFALIATAWLVKAAVVPFHFWLADAHAVAPAPVCVLFSGVMAPLGLYGLGRVYWTAFRGVLPASAVHRALLVLGVLTALLGALMCFTQRHLKRLLAYSTIAHIGLFLLGLAALSPLGTTGAALYIAGHAGVKGALFLLAGVLLSRYRSVDEYELHGRARSDRFTAVLFLLAALALAGLPPFGTGLGKALIERAGGGEWAAVLAIAVSAMTGGAVLRAGLRVYFGLGPHPDEQATADTTTGRNEEPDMSTPTRVPVTMLAAIVLLLAVGLAVGVLPAVARFAGPAGAMFTDQRGYLAQALQGAGPSTAAVPDTGWTGDDLLPALLSTGLAVLLAVTAVFAVRLPAALRRAARAARPAVTELHRLHSGHLGDYVAWLVFGAAALAGLLILG